MPDSPTPDPQEFQSDIQTCQAHLEETQSKIRQLEQTEETYQANLTRHFHTKDAHDDIIRAKHLRTENQADTFPYRFVQTYARQTNEAVTGPMRRSIEESFANTEHALKKAIGTTQESLNQERGTQRHLNNKLDDLHWAKRRNEATQENNGQ